MQHFEQKAPLAELLAPDQIERLNRILHKLDGAALSIAPADAGQAVEFNLDTVAWIIGGSNEEKRAALVELVQFVLYFVTKYRMAANLHRDVTEASYTELLRQNEALRASQARYRELSDQLQKRVDEQVHMVEQAQKDLYQSAHLRAVGQLSAGVAHEINNPVGFIASNLRVANDYLDEFTSLLPADPETRESLNDFRDLVSESIDGAKRIAAIVADLKTFSSIDQADQTYGDVNALISSAVHLLQTQYHNRLDVRWEPGLIPSIFCYPAQLSQAFLNLLDNAAKALTAEGGLIQVRTRHMEGTNRIGIIIEDNGCGIADDQRERIFDAFFTTRGVGSGVGLGLTVARDIVRAHRGVLHLESAFDRGTRVTIQLPISQSQ